MVRVLVCDSHYAIQDALSRTISTDPDLELAGVTGSADEVASLVDANKPDLLVLELALHGTYGLELVQNLRARYPGLRVLVYSMYDESLYAERAIRAGASGFVMKDQPTETVTGAIHAIARGEIYLSGSMASSLLKRLVDGQSAEPDHLTHVLTDREMAVFQLLGEGHDVQSIADQLHLSRKTIETYRRRAKEKLGFESITELLQYAVRSARR